MSQQELLTKVIKTLGAIGVDYMVTGSLASSLQGEPRSTHDIDMVVVVREPAIPKLLDAFASPDYYLDEESLRGAVRSKGMFNLIDVKGGDKVDFWLLTEEPFDQSRFARKYTENIMGMEMKVSSPEDSILMKLRWSKMSGGSQKQFIDALRIYEVQFKKLDHSYIDKWVKQLSIDSEWQRLIKEAQIVE
jgi:hypothetical protein